MFICCKYTHVLYKEYIRLCVEGLIDQRVDMSDDTVSWKLFRLGTVSGLSHGVGREGGG